MSDPLGLVKLISGAIVRANNGYPDHAGRPAHPPHKAALADLFVACLATHPKKASVPMTEARQEMEARVFPALPALDPLDASRHVFRLEELQASLKQFQKARRPEAPAASYLLLWLLGGELIADPWLGACREICSRLGVTVEFVEIGRADRLVESLGFGLWRDAAWTEEGPHAACLERESDLTRHLIPLEMAVRRRRGHVIEGEAEVGKSVFLLELLRRALVRWAASSDPTLRAVRFVLLGGKDFRGDREWASNRARQLSQFLARTPAVALVVDDMEPLVNPYSPAHEGFTEHLAGLTHGGTPVVFVGQTGATTRSELLRHLTPRPLPALTVDRATRVVERHVPELLSAEGLVGAVPDAALFARQVVETARDRYPRRYLPGIAIDLARCVIGRVAGRRGVADLGKPPPTITEADIWEHVVEELNLNPELVGRSPSEFYGRLRVQLKKRILGQDHVVDLVCRSLESLAGRRRQLPTPRGRYLFMGPPGVGKTQLARSLAGLLGSEDEGFFAFNMSEYSSETARTRFIGADPGYVGFQTTRTLYDLVRAQPSCVVLLDEIDRAHSSLQDILLSILEGNGRDNQGQLIDFRQVIFMLTTNLGQDAITVAYEAGGSREQLARQLDDRRLRAIILKGLEDPAEESMMTFLEAEVRRRSDEVTEGLKRAGAGESDVVNAQIDRYLDAKQRVADLRAKQRTSPLDRAFLDRIDFVLPFFPIDEKEGHLTGVLDLILERFDWNDCPHRTEILAEAEKNKVSMRGLERLVRERLARAATPME